MKNNSNIDKIIIDLIMDHYNATKLFWFKNKIYHLTEFDDIVDMAESIYLKKVIITEKPALA